MSLGPALASGGISAVSGRLQKRQRSEALLTPPELRGGARVSVIRVRENYHSGVLIGSNSKMNGALNSDAAGRKTLRTVDFSPHRSAPRMRLVPSEWEVGQFAKPLTTKDTKVHEGDRELVHDLSQALHDGGESGALKLRANLR